MDDRADEHAGRGDAGTCPHHDVDTTGHAARDPTAPGHPADPDPDPDDWADGDDLPFLAGPVPTGFARRVVEIGPGASRPYDTAEWTGALVVVERGDLVLECRRGGRRTFPAGSVLSLAGLPLHTMRSTRDGPVVLVSVVRD